MSALAGRQQLQSLTSLRFFAAIYVVIYHYWTSYQLGVARPLLIDLGQSGVTFFFLLSGFILSYSYDEAGGFRKGGRRRFYLARFARVYPLYIVTILVMFPVLVFKSGVADQGYRELWAITSPLAVHAWIPGAACSLNCPNWSISTEAFFYLLFPFVLAPIYRRPVLVISAAWAVMVVIWIVQAEIWIASGRALAEMKTVTLESDRDGALLMQLFTYLPLARLPEFFAGIGLYGLWRRLGNRISPTPLYGAAGLAAVIIVAAAPWVPESVLRTGFAAICYAPLILAAANSRSGPLVRPDFVWLGHISFALYLVHSPVDSYLRNIDRVALGSQLAAMPFLFFCIATAVALISAALLFHLLEEPARKALMRWFDASSRPPARSRRMRTASEEATIPARSSQLPSSASPAAVNIVGAPRIFSASENPAGAAVSRTSEPGYK